MIGKIYKISNDVNQKLYVGKTKHSLKLRFNQHKRANTVIGRAIRKYGEEHFKIELIEECATEEELNAREMYWIATLNSKHPNGYNMTDGGEGMLNPTLEVRQKISNSRTGRKGVSPSAETRALISKALTGRKKTKSHPAWNKGKKMTPEYCETISKSQTGKKLSEEARINISAAMLCNTHSVGNKNHLGHKHSAETRAKMSAKRKLRVTKDETRQKMSVSQKKRHARERVTKENLEAAATVDRFKHLMEDVFSLF